MSPSSFSLPLTTSTTSRCRPSPSPREGYVIQLTRPAGILLPRSSAVSTCQVNRPRFARLHRAEIMLMPWNVLGTFFAWNQRMKIHENRDLVSRRTADCAEDQVPSLLPSTILLVLIILRQHTRLPRSLSADSTRLIDNALTWQTDIGEDE